jgi:hypothetical protein
MKSLRIAAVALAALLFACSTSPTPATIERRTNQREEYAWALLYAKAPELRAESLDLYETNSGDGARMAKKPEDAEWFSAKWRYKKDGDEVYRFISLQRLRANIGKADEVVLSTGRARAANINHEPICPPAP